MHIAHGNNFVTWRETARRLLRVNIAPESVIWNDSNNQALLFAQNVKIDQSQIGSGNNNNVPKEFLKLAELVCHHRSKEHFDLLYQALWRLIYENKNLLKIATDPLINKLNLMTKSIKRDIHKTHAFVRFRKKYDEDCEEHYIAWHKPDHYSLKLSAPFFARRFATMRWTILTPDESVHWDKNILHFGEGAKASDAPNEDKMEELWKDFYRAIFNPARIKIKAMKREMPVRHWATMPEAEIIPSMLVEASERVKVMLKHQEGHSCSALDFMPKDLDINKLSNAAKNCRGCPLYQNSTQTVFGLGPENATLVLVGEQPGDEEDKIGKPYIGPAGKILDKALAEANLERTNIYLTNAVKHFKFYNVDNKRIHRTPGIQDITNCRPWLRAELAAIKPKLVVCLGLTAAKSLISPRFTLENRSKLITREGVTYLPTYHPSAVLRAQQEELSIQIYQTIVQDLKLAKSHIESLGEDL